eukprot:IDg7972t1
MNNFDRSWGNADFPTQLGRASVSITTLRRHI